MKAINKPIPTGIAVRTGLGIPVKINSLKVINFLVSLSRPAGITERSKKIIPLIKISNIALPNEKVNPNAPPRIEPTIEFNPIPDA